MCVCVYVCMYAVIILIIVIILGTTDVCVNKKVYCTVNDLFKSQFFLERSTRFSDADLSSTIEEFFMESVTNNTSGYENVR